MGEKDEEKAEGKEEQGIADDTDAGDKPEESKAVAKLSKENERLETQLAKKKQLLAEQRELEAKEAVGGKAEAGMKPPAPKKPSDEEYAELVRQGKANPLKDDGFI